MKLHFTRPTIGTHTIDLSNVELLIKHITFEPSISYYFMYFIRLLKDIRLFSLKSRIKAQSLRRFAAAYYCM